MKGICSAFKRVVVLGQHTSFSVTQPSHLVCESVDYYNILCRPRFGKSVTVSLHLWVL